MMALSAALNDSDVRHCETLAVDWSDPGTPSQEVRADGEHLHIGISIFHLGEHSEELDAPLGEEVATVLEGAFLIEAAGERYELSPGEGIIIPPFEPRVWTCQTARGVLYRVVTKPGALTPDAEAAAS